MAQRRRSNVCRGIVAALGGCAVAVLASGCPGFEIEDVALASSSVDDVAFTLAATVVVTEEDPAVDDNGDLSGGRGRLGVWLPPDWEVVEARVRAPEDAGFAALTPIPDGDGHFPAPFPWVPGAWSAFASPCDNIEEGTFEYLVEIDVVGSASGTDVVLGISTALFDEAGSNGAPPVEAAVDLAAGTVDVREAPAAPASAGLDACEAVPYEEPPKDACTCAAPGSPARRPSLVGALSALF
ncbi:MAG TPA: hypothetical protein VM285_10265 [Polyangia bacterium]|nr:hypothetical protein [Polyangia bacterium]